MRSKITLQKWTAFLCIAIAPSLAFAQAGSLDLSFDTDGMTTTAVSADNTFGNAVAMQNDGKIVVVGSTSSAGAVDNIPICRYNTDGSLDSTFAGDGIQWITDLGIWDEGATAVAIQDDGKIVVAAYSSDSAAHFFILRYETDGSPDTTFDGDGILPVTIGTDDAPYGIAIQPDGKIVVVGVSNYHMTAVRCNPDGSLDNSFDTDGIVIVADGPTSGAFGKSVALQSDGKIVIAGQITPTGGNADFYVVRLDTNGGLDASFDTDGRATFAIGASNDYGQSVAIQGDGKIVVGGFASIGGNYNFALARLHSDGSLDNSFDTDGKLNMAFDTKGDVCHSIALQSDGKILAAGYRDTGPGVDLQFAVARFDTNGALDITFDGDGKVTTKVGTEDVANGMALQSDGKIVVVGNSSVGGQLVMAVVRYNNDGTAEIFAPLSSPVGMTIHPHPFSNSATIQVSTELKDATLSISNLQGQLVSQIEHLHGNTIDVTRDNLPSGTYLATITQDNVQLAAMKLVITN